VKKNQPGLHAQLKNLPWDRATAKFYDRSEGHGRRETPRGAGPHRHRARRRLPARHQVAKILRHRTCTRTGKRSRETAYLLTDLTRRQASPERLAKIVRSQWTIENRLHFVRNTTFAEDASKIRTGHGPENTSTLRSHAINRLRASVCTSCAVLLSAWAASLRSHRSVNSAATPAGSVLRNAVGAGGLRLRNGRDGAGHCAGEGQGQRAGGERCPHLWDSVARFAVRADFISFTSTITVSRWSVPAGRPNRATEVRPAARASVEIEEVEGM
jgi:predicted transposase YbfD/YdcC